MTERKPGDNTATTPGSDPDSVLAKVWNNTVDSIDVGAGTPWPDFLRHPEGAEEGDSGNP